MNLQQNTHQQNMYQTNPTHQLEKQQNTTQPTTRPRIVIPEAPPLHQHHQQHSSNSPSDSPGTGTNFFVYPENIIDEGVNACKKSILGKIITVKPIHVSSIQNGLENIWGSPQGLKIQEIENGILQFFTNNPIDQERILLGNPWIFRNSWLIVKAWDRKVDPSTMDFTHAPVWVQLWGLPPHCKSKKMGESIGKLWEMLKLQNSMSTQAKR
ncbi:hypothetical protein QL285_037344 [Trifolium repens]|jgi:hypothetical protein|nr:hypothetical protein QL285_037344 [Trifolium repens]